MIFGKIDSFCESFVAPDGISSNKIFLYSVGTAIADEFIPICQFSSEESSYLLIYRFFSECCKSGLRPPKKLIVDYNANHYTAANSVFNVNLTYEKYLTKCFLYLKYNTSNSELPKCLIKANVKLDSIKYFYIYCIISLSFQKNLDDFENLLEKIFILAYSKFQTQSTSSSFSYIQSKINELKIDSAYQKENVICMESEFKNIMDPENNNFKVNYNKCEEILNYIKGIFLKARNQVSIISKTANNERNAFYNENYCESIIELCLQFVVWSDVFNDLHCDDHCINENFGILLDNYKAGFQEHLSGLTSIDQYLFKNIDHADEQLQIAKTLMIHEKKEKVKEVCFEYSYLKYEENWRGKNKQSAMICDEPDDSDCSSNSDIDKSSDSNEFEESNFLDKDTTDINTIIDSVCESLYEQKPFSNSVSESADVSEPADHTNLDDKNENEKSICENKNSDEKLSTSKVKNTKQLKKNKR